MEREPMSIEATGQQGDHRPMVRILVVDDHALTRLGIAATLATAQRVRFELVEATSLADALALFDAGPAFDLVLLDLNLPDCRGLQGLRQFREAHRQARIVVISGTQDEFVVGQVRALGAVAYITKGQSTESMCELVCSLLPSASAPPVPAACRFPRSVGQSRFDRVAELGPRHLEILELVLSGCSNQEISTATGLSLGTIKNYVSTVLLAMDVKSRSHLISLFS